MQRLADCVVAADSAGSVALIKTYPYSDGERKQAAAIIEAKGTCGNVEGRIAPSYLRGAIAESLYRRRFAQAPAAGEAPVVMPSEADWGNRANLVQTNRLSNCIVSTDVVAVDALIRSEAGTGEEEVAFASLGSALTQCAQKFGSLQIGVQMLRSVLAESLYRLALVKANDPLPALPWPPAARN